jgi:hypothetical protein
MNQLWKQAQNDTKVLHNPRKRELCAIQRVDLAKTKAENLQARVTELTATVEAKNQDAPTEVEVMAISKSWKVRYDPAALVIGALLRQGLITNYNLLSIS